MNLKAITDSNPDIAKYLSMHYKNAEYADPFGTQDPHAPKRSYNEDSPMTKKIQHNYTQQVKNHSKDLNNRGKTFRVSAMSMISNTTPGH